MTNLIPSIKEVIEGLSSTKAWLGKRKKQFILNAWENSDLSKAYEAIIRYYDDMHEGLFSYLQSDGSRVTVPLYVAPGWDTLSEISLQMHLSETTRSYYPTKPQKDFWEFYCELKKIESKKDEWPLYDSPIFRLTELDIAGDSVQLGFELGEFPYSVMCQYILEHELVMLLAKNPAPKHNEFKIRNSVANDTDMIPDFFRNNVGRIGICNLILLRVNSDTYVPMVQPRSGLSMVRGRLVDVVSSCIFEVATAPKVDFELQHTVLREIYEELFGNPEVAERSRNLDPRFFYKEDGINDLLELIQDGSAVFEITGFCIDLVRIVPEITTLLIVRDESYYRRHFSPTESSVAPFKLNPEFDLASLFHIPINLNDVEAYLTSDLIADLNGDSGRRGFDPMKWTLPGGFSFYQGLNRAVHSGLL